MTSEDMVRPLRPLDLLEPWEDHPQFELEFADVDEQDPDYDPEIQMTTARRLARAYARNTRLLRIFQEVFYQQYFLALRERHEGLKSTKGIEPKEGDIVMLHDDHEKQIRWKLGRIVRILPGQDGRFRTAEVKVYTPTTKRLRRTWDPLLDRTSILKRAIVSLYFLEHYLLPNSPNCLCSSPEPSSSDGNDSSDSESDGGNDLPGYDKRARNRRAKAKEPDLNIMSRRQTPPPASSAIYRYHPFRLVYVINCRLFRHIYRLIVHVLIALNDFHPDSKTIICMIIFLLLLLIFLQRLI
jgi:hypothetical protein